MKHLLIFLVLAIHAQVAFPQAWSYRPTTFANGFVQTVNNQAQAATYLGFSSSTNTVTLTGTQTITGTKTFPTSLYSANNIGLRHLWSSPTNIFLASLAASAGLAFTNNGDFSLGTYIAQFTIPPLISSNSSLAMVIANTRTNANASAGVINVYIGSNTNFVGNTVSFLATAVGHNTQVLVDVLSGWNSWTAQLQGSSFQNVRVDVITNYCDFSVSNTVYVSGMTATGHTNANMILRFFEIVSP